MKKTLRVLHLGNIANNAYLNAKFLREKGILADVISHDYDDSMATPEWEDDCRPTWFMAGSLENIARRYRYKEKFSKLLFKKDFSSVRLNYWRDKLNEVWIIFSRYFNPYFEYVSFKEYLYFKKLIKIYKKNFAHRKDCLTIEDILPYTPQIKIFKKIFQKYNIVQCYGTEPIYALLSMKKPYIAFEHGTLREFPFQKNAQGRLLSLAYRLADVVIITNPDNIVAGKKLNLKNFTYVPHPINDREIAKTKPIKTLRAELKIFAPARHNWKVKGNDLIIKGFYQFCHRNSDLKSLLFFSKWGQEIEKSKKLIKKLGLEDKIIWLPPMSKHILYNYYQSSDIVLDQFQGYFGTTSPEAMASQKPVIMWFDKKIYRWAFHEMPPVLMAKTPNEISAALEKLLSKKLREEIGQASFDWIKKYHSSNVVTKKLIDIYEKF